MKLPVKTVYTDTTTTVQLADIPIMGGLDDSPRGRVLRAAAYLFRRQGYERTTVRDIAKIIGIQSGSLFHHFENKNEMLKAIMHEAIVFYTAKMQDAAQRGKTIHEKLLNLIATELDSINGKTSDGMTVLVHEWSALSPENQHTFLQMRAGYEQVWLDVLEQAQHTGLIQHSPKLWRKLIGGAISWTSTWYQANGELDLNALAQTLMEMTVHASPTMKI